MSWAQSANSLFTEVEAARWLKISPRTLRKERQDGKIHYVLIRSAVRYSFDDLTRYIENARTCQSTSEKAPPIGGTHSRSTVSDFEEVRARRRSARRS
ncbi:helix-turn-helix domain-containing protein [Sphingomonas cavernae]|uniref:DNA-binding protein n=1 Tax=Sphingomonas cavernae TaxID=2320861 RepID=A0A418WP57_9SPHN|nr:DNA-binding protein [Sphingomonas cavernae]